MAALGELGRFPHHKDIYENIMKFYCNKKVLIHYWTRQTLEVSKQLNNVSYKSWFTGVRTFLNDTQFHEENMTLVKNNLRSLYRNI